MFCHLYNLGLISVTAPLSVEVKVFRSAGTFCSSLGFILPWTHRLILSLSRNTLIAKGQMYSKFIEMTCSQKLFFFFFFTANRINHWSVLYHTRGQFGFNTLSGMDSWTGQLGTETAGSKKTCRTTMRYGATTKTQKRNKRWNKITARRHRTTTKS